MNFKPTGWHVSWYDGDKANVSWNVAEIYFDDATGITYIIHSDGTASVYEFDYRDIDKLVIGLESYIVTDIYPEVFKDASFTIVELPEGMTTIGDYAFYRCTYLEKITLPNTLVEIGTYAFYNCDALTSITIPEGVTTIESHAFYSCGALTRVVLPSTITEIGEHAFADCYALKTINLPEGLTKIANYAFQSCSSLYTVTLPSTLLEIGEYAFAWSGTQTVIIPKSVTTIGHYAFTNGTIFVCEDKKPAGWHNEWNGTDRKNDAKFGFKELYTDSYGVTYALFNNNTAVIMSWDGKQSDLVLGVDGFALKEIPSGIFNSNSTLLSVVIPEGVTKIGNYAFDGCSALANVTLPSTLTTISENAFSSCDSLISIVIPEGVTKIGSHAFYSCDNLRSVTLPTTLTDIGSWAFYDNYQLIIFIPTTVISIDECAFAYCNKIYCSLAQAPDTWHSGWNNYNDSNVTWNVAEMYTDAYGVSYVKFNDNTAIITGVSGIVSEIVLGGNPDFRVTEIPAYLLSGRTDITKVTIGEDITTIGAYAFNNSYCNVILHEGITSIGYYAFNNCYAFVIGAEKQDGWDDAWCGENNQALHTVFWNFKELYTDENGFYYALTDKGVAYLYNYTGDATEITIGKLVIGENSYDVIILGAFEGNSALEKVTLLDGVIEVGTHAFRNCRYIKELTLSETLTKIGYDAFYQCDSLVYVVLPDSLQSVESHAFCHSGCYVYVSGNIAEIGQNAFYECNVFTNVSNDSATWPSGWNAQWYGWNANIEWNAPEGNLYINDNGALYLLCEQDKTAHLYSFGSSNAGELVIESVPGYSTIVYRSTNALDETVTKLIIGEGVVKIANEAFYSWTSLTEITLPSTLIEIENYAFAYCNNLTSIVLPDSLKTIGTHAFYCTYCHIYIPDTVETIENHAFSYCYPYVEIAQQPESDAWDGWNGWHTNYTWGIPAGSFYTNENGMTYWLCDEDMTARLYYYDVSAAELIIDGVENYSVIVYNSPNYGNNVVSKLVIGEGVVKINAHTFQDWQMLTELSLPSTLVEIELYAFFNTQIENLTIPATVQIIGECAFSSDNIIRVPVNTKPANWHENWYTGEATNVYWNIQEFITDEYGVTYALHPDGTASVYSFDDTLDIEDIVIQSPKEGYVVTDIYAKAFQNKYLLSITLPEGLTIIGDYAFYNCDALTQITLPSTLQYIGSYAFHNCRMLQQTTLPNALLSIGNYAFSNCDSLTEVVIPQNVTTLGNYAFQDCDYITSVQILGALSVFGENAFQSCDRLTTVVIGEGVTKISNGAFRDCNNIQTVTLPSTLTEIGNYAFYYCNSLSSIVIPEGVTKIGIEAFGCCYNLQNVTLPSTLTEIGDYAFYHCNSLSSIVILEGVTKIGHNAFQYCYSLRTVTLPSTLTEIGNYAFNNTGAVVTIPASVKTIGDYAFTGGKIFVELANKPRGWSSYWNGENGKEYTFWNFEGFKSDAYGVTYVLLGGSTPTAVLHSFDGKATEIVLGVDGYTLTAIPDGFFSSSEIVSVVIPEGVTQIGGHAFQYCYSLQNVILPSTLIEIGNYAFYCCNSLSSITIPESVSKIGEYAFSNCNALTSIYIPAGIETISYGAFNVYGYCTIYVGANEKPAGWNERWAYTYDEIVWGYVPET